MERPLNGGRRRWFRVARRCASIEHDESGVQDMGEPLRGPDKPEDESFYSPFGRRSDRARRRRDRIAEEILANRRGEYAVPTWVLVAALVVVVGGFALWLILL
jgi:hypothetical protein